MSPANVTVRQAGWSGSFGRTFTESDTCNSGPYGAPAAITTSDHLSFVVTAADPGSCVMTLTGGAAQTVRIPITVTTASVTVN